MIKNDLTQGNVWKKLILYFVPLAIGTFFQQLYNAIDGLVVGKYVGTIALAAVGGSASLVSMALVNFFVGLTSGGSILIAQFFGARDSDRLSKSVHTSLLFATLCGVVISIIGYIFTANILYVMKTPAETMEDSIVYLRIIFVGVLFQVLYNMGAGILRAVGDSKSPFIYLAISSIVNIVVDIWFVCGLNLGVSGAAYATILAQGISCVLVITKLMRVKGESYALDLNKLRIDFILLKRILKIGIPLGLQSLMYSFTNILVQVGINTLGTVVVAAWTIEEKIDAFFWGLMASVNTTISNFVGQNYGKGDFTRMKKGVKASFVIFGGMSVAFCAFMLLTQNIIVPLFNDDPEVIETGIWLVRFFGPIYWIWVINEIFSGALRGEGKTIVPFIIIAVSVCLFRLIWLKFVFSAYPTLKCLSSCYPVSWTLTSSGMAVYYLIHMKHKTVVK